MHKFDKKIIKQAPITFHEYYKEVIWGGDRIAKYKGVAQLKDKIGESWEISQVPGHVSVVDSGDYKGLTITQLIEMFGDSLLGNAVNTKYNGAFPLLIKFIDANDNLSVQVHPNDELAKKRHGCLGKTEMWYIIDASEDAKIYAGLKSMLSPNEYVKRIETKTFMDAVAVHDSHAGDIFYLPAGSVHAIGSGNLIAEIQESSDITYRIYDFDRVDGNGNPRELHTQLAKDAIDYNISNTYKHTPLSHDNEDCEIVNCEHFRSRRIKLNGEKYFELDGNSFTVVMCISGTVKIIGKEGWVKLRAGKTALLPATLSNFKLQGEAILILTRA